MLKRILAFALLAILLLGLIAPVARATEETTAATEAEEDKLGGWLDDHFRWELVDGTLTITGDGVMPGKAPWRDYADQIENLFFDGDIYTVQSGAFRDCKNLKEIQFSSALTEIGDNAFLGCESLKEIRLPQGFKRFGASSFGGCSSLRQVYCDGYMPRFSEACLWNEERIYVYYSPERPWKAEDMVPLEGVYGGRLEFLCQDGTDPILNGEGDPEPIAPVAAVTEPAPPATEAPTVPTTEATEPPTIPTVPETTVPEITVPETTQAVLTETVPEPTVQMGAPTEPPAEIEKETVKGGVVGLVLIVGVLTFFIVGALVFKIRSRGGRY